MPPNPFGKIDKVKMNPPAGSPDLVEPAGPTDPTVSFIALREPGGRLISVYSGLLAALRRRRRQRRHLRRLLRHVLRGAGEAAERRRAGAALRARMMANGTSGDINNINFRNAAPAHAALRADALRRRRRGRQGERGAGESDVEGPRAAGRALPRTGARLAPDRRGTARLGEGEAGQAARDSSKGGPARDLRRPRAAARRGEESGARAAASPAHRRHLHRHLPVRDVCGDRPGVQKAQPVRRSPSWSS